ncbi:MAG: hypothetical protein ACFFG0_21750, partial [Candidatus Thorarchaeota archaeon]
GAVLCVTGLFAAAAQNAGLPLFSAILISLAVGALLGLTMGILVVKVNLPSYGIPIFLRFKSELTTTATFKLKKVKLKKEGFDFEKIDDPIYVLLPDESKFTSLTREIYENIQNRYYKF